MADDAAFRTSRFKVGTESPPFVISAGVEPPIRRGTTGEIVQRTVDGNLLVQFEGHPAPNSLNPPD
jgi:hypothetical protein